MSGRPCTGRTRARGNIEELPSGALRVRVYAGIDPFTGKRHFLIGTVDPGRKKWDEAEAVRARFLLEVAQRRAPMTSATVDELLEKYLDGFAGSPTTLDLYRTTSATTSRRAWGTSRPAGSTPRRWTRSTAS